LGQGRWHFAEDRRDEIAAHWQKRLVEAPSMWDGQVLHVQNAGLRDGILHGTLLPVRFSAHLAWRDWGRPESGVTQLFGSGIVRSSDGAIILGKMRAHTANAGAVYPSSGMLDRSDIGPDGRADVFGSVARELEEEMGLRIEEGAIADSFIVWDGAAISVNRIVDFLATGDDLVRRVRHTLRGQSDPELADVVVVRSAEDLAAAGVKQFWMPAILRALGAA
jgi:8-oxo-dGTP pyrophosphatase MutT (NUDIX family)